MHSDHVEGFIDVMQLRWHNVGTKLDVVRSADAVSPLGHTVSCKKFAAHIGDTLFHAGEIAQRVTEDKRRPSGGPAELTNVTSPSSLERTLNRFGHWAKVRVQAIRSTHMPGHASYRVDTPAVSVVIGGDARNDKSAPPRDYSISDQLEKLAKAADVMVHSVIHPIMAPDTGGGFAAPVYNRQSTVGDLGAMARRAGVKHLMLTHMIPPLGADVLGRYKSPAVQTEADYRKPVEAFGFRGSIVVGTESCERASAVELKEVCARYQPARQPASRVHLKNLRQQTASPPLWRLRKTCLLAEKAQRRPDRIRLIARNGPRRVPKPACRRR